MNKLKIDEMVIAAVDILEKNSLSILEQGKVPSQYNSYLAAFGPSLVQTGLLQTVDFYSKKKSQEEKERVKIIQLMEKTLEKTGRIQDKPPETSLSKYLKDSLGGGNFQRHITLKNYLMESCVACKLALRTFPKKDKKNA
ncbi:CRISPR-associated Cmr5 family protein [Candidatus Magnetomorum sp. HK-1]|nr:CRISPR-associated Cmr5 family protein [Candidatus Magnetomorum sp. HK-1]